MKEEKGPFIILFLFAFVLGIVIFTLLRDVTTRTIERNNLAIICYDNNISIDKKYDKVIKDKKIQRYSEALEK